MPDASSSSALKFYPSEYWPASPTYNVWAKLSAADVHKLVRRPGLNTGNRVWFHLNHPIRYVRLVGLVVAYEGASELAELFGSDKRVVTQQRPHVFTVDDGSGETLDVVLWHKGKEAPKLAKFPGELIQLGPLDFKKKVGQSVTGRIVDLEAVEVGKIVKVKGWVDEFRGRKQMLLERVSLVSDTAEEAREWKELASFQSRVLSKPWEMRPEKMEKLLKTKALKAKARRHREKAALAPDTQEDVGQAQNTVEAVDVDKRFLENRDAKRSSFGVCAKT